MSNYKYSTQIQNEHTARAVGRDLSISMKASVEICRWLKHRDLQKAKKLLSIVLEKKMAVPYLRFNTDVGHKPGIAAGRYPQKASQEILNLLNSVEKNAGFKNLDTENLKIVHMNAHKASTPVHYGRHGGREMKRTHVEVVVAEYKPAKTEAKKKKTESTKKVETKTENKVEKKVETKPETKVEEKTETKVEQPKNIETKTEKPKVETQEQGSELRSEATKETTKEAEE